MRGGLVTAGPPNVKPAPKTHFPALRAGPVDPKNEAWPQTQSPLRRGRRGDEASWIEIGCDVRADPGSTDDGFGALLSGGTSATPSTDIPIPGQHERSRFRAPKTLRANGALRVSAALVLPGAEQHVALFGGELLRDAHELGQNRDAALDRRPRGDR